jgi:uncharacterized protein (TIGR02466 family)
MNIEVADLFSIPLFYFKVDPDNETEIKTYIKNQHKKYYDSNLLNEYVCGNDTNYSDSCIDHIVLKNLIEKIENNVKDIFLNFYHYDGILPYVSDIWTTCVKPKEIGPNKHFHTHSNSLFSGVWYPFENSSPIVFRNERKDFFTIHQDKEKINERNKKFMFNEYSDTKVLPQKHAVVLFPSYLSHAVAYHENLTPRYSVPFNIFFKGHLNTQTANLNI